MFLRESHQSTTPSSEEPVDKHPGFKPGVATLMSPALFISSEEEMFAGGTSGERALRLRSRPCPRGPDRSGGGGCQRVWECWPAERQPLLPHHPHRLVCTWGRWCREWNLVTPRNSDFQVSSGPRTGSFSSKDKGKRT